MIARAAAPVALLALLACAREAATAPARPVAAKKPVPSTAVADTRAAMRQRLLTGSAADFHIALPKGRSVWGVVMEMGYPNDATVSVIALADGHASISLSTAPDVISGGDREAVRKAALHVTEAAEEAAPHLAKAKSFPAPKLDEVTFYLLTRDGVVTETATQEELAGGAHPLSPLFMAAQDVITRSR
jgi:hypothetical protein